MTNKYNQRTLESAIKLTKAGDKMVPDRIKRDAEFESNISGHQRLSRSAAAYFETHPHAKPLKNLQKYRQKHQQEIDELLKTAPDSSPTARERWLNLQFKLDYEDAQQLTETDQAACCRQWYLAGAGKAYIKMLVGRSDRWFSQWEVFKSDQ